MKLLTKEQLKWYTNVKICYICKEKSENKYVKDIRYIVKLDIILIISGNIEVLHITFNLKYSIPKKFL